MFKESLAVLIINGFYCMCHLYKKNLKVYLGKNNIKCYKDNFVPTNILFVTLLPVCILGVDWILILYISPGNIPGYTAYVCKLSIFVKLTLNIVRTYIPKIDSLLIKKEINNFLVY